MSGSATTLESNSSYILFIIITALVGVIGGGFGIYEFIIKRLRAEIDKEFSSSYIDAASNEYVEKYKFKIINGKTLCKTISLPKTSSKESTVRLCYKPATSYKQELDMDYYNFEEDDGNKKIKLSVKFLRAQEVEEIYATIISKLNGKDIEKFSQNISSNITTAKIIITNNNMEEIIHYPIEIPTNIPLDKIKFFESREYVEAVHRYSKPGNSPDENLVDDKIVVTLRKIPPKIDDAVGVVELALLFSEN